MRPLCLVLALLLTSPVARAETPVDVTDIWVRLNPPGTQVTAAFLTLRNSGSKDIQLVRAETPVARVSELHNHVQEGGVMKMRQVQGIPVRAKGETLLKPGSYHVMLIDLKAPLREGESIPLTLGFDDGSTVKITGKVRRPAAEGHHH